MAKIKQLVSHVMFQSVRVCFTFQKLKYLASRPTSGKYNSISIKRLLFWRGLHWRTLSVQWGNALVSLTGSPDMVKTGICDKFWGKCRMTSFQVLRCFLFNCSHNDLPLSMLFVTYCTGHIKVLWWFYKATMKPCYTGKGFSWHYSGFVAMKLSCFT